jgi:hypothetical protein
MITKMWRDTERQHGDIISLLTKVKDKETRGETHGDTEILNGELIIFLTKIKYITPTGGETQKGSMVIS